MIGAGVPLGAGEPDLLVVEPSPALLRLPTRAPRIVADLLAAIQERPGIDPLDLRDHLRLTPHRLDDLLSSLADRQIIRTGPKGVRLAPDWRDPLRRVVAVEAKVANWRRVIEQAARNRFFAHYSYVAVPQRLATRVSDSSMPPFFGLGILAVDSTGSVSFLRRAPRHTPLLWTYYYELARIVRRSFTGGSQCHTRSRSTSQGRTSPRTRL